MLRISLDLSQAQRAAKLRKLCDIEGFQDETALFAAAVSDTTCPAICCNPDNPDCNYTAEMEPDQDQGWCDACERRTLVSGLVLGGLI
jgi:histidinol-phosphate/aromatic aminotransferase/cobyric acid decarboxylase-like protein